MKADYVHKDTLTATDYVELNKNNELLMSYNQALLKENQELKKQLEEVEFIVGLRQKKNLISKFNKEYDEEDKKKNPNRDYAGIMPDAEEVYRRYYTMKNQQKEFIDWLENEKDRLIKECSHHYTDSFDRQHAVNEDMYDEVDKISIKFKEIVGGKE